MKIHRKNAGAVALMVKSLSGVREVAQVGYIGTGKHKDSGLSVAEIAAVHEFGAPSKGIPERSHLRAALFEQRDNINKLAASSAKKIVNQQMDVPTMMGRLGLFGQAAVQHKIRHGNFAPLKDATIARKGSSKPLIDTGQMIQSVTFNVVKK